MRGRVELVVLGALLGGAVVAVTSIWGIPVVLGTFVNRSMCPGGARCRDAWSAVGWLAMVVALSLLIVLGRRAVAQWVSRPLTDMVATIEHMGPQNLGQRIQQEDLGGDLRVMADAVNRMLDRVAVGFEGQRRFASAASHELRTPLAVQRTLAEVAMVTSDGKDSEVNRLGAQLLMVNERNERLIEGLLVLAEADRGLPGTVPVRLDELTASVLTDYADQLAERGLTVRQELAVRTVPGDPVLLERMISNLVHNAMKYNNPGGWVEVVVADEPALSVHNTGQRIPGQVVTSLFEPFRRLAAERMNHRDGAGLGLSIVQSIAVAHSGSVSAAPGSDGGLRVEVTLPLSAQDRCGGA
ncbi:histidine kinase [Kibdelosporangium phytohabitans]|uniref:histidine kinase n=1 Tax=Kibdelosporangium phytohabitans TaxID=860235 RepID=A0A0N9HSC5_9PSEU|nr:histidine kinase [Kibdelosporangium phytohabitans]